MNIWKRIKKAIVDWLDFQPKPKPDHDYWTMRQPGYIYSGDPLGQRGTLCFGGKLKAYLGSNGTIDSDIYKGYGRNPEDQEEPIPEGAGWPEVDRAVAKPGPKTDMLFFPETWPPDDYHPGLGGGRGGKGGEIITFGPKAPRKPKVAKVPKGATRVAKKPKKAKKARTGGSRRVQGNKR